MIALRHFWVGAALLLCATPSTAQADGAASESDVFVKTIWPILESKCTECHRAPYKDARGRTRKPKAGLRLDGRRFLLEGGDDGPAVVPGDVADSLLHERIALEDDDPDLMPEDGPRLDDSEIEAIRKWIADGADFGDWVGEGGLPDSKRVATRKSVRELALEALAEGLEPISKTRRTKVIAGFEDGAVQLIDLEPQGRLVRVQFAAHQGSIDDKSLRSLDPILDRVVEIDLGRTRITDRGLKALKRADRLVSLDLSRTGLDGSGLAQLEGLEHLAVLNLFQCSKLKASAAKSIGKLESLKQVYLGGTGWTADDLSKVRQILPRARVVGDPQLPAPRTGGNQTGGRRRR